MSALILNTTFLFQTEIRICHTKELFNKFIKRNHRKYITLTVTTIKTQLLRHLRACLTQKALNFSIRYPWFKFILNFDSLRSLYHIQRNKYKYTIEFYLVLYL